MYVDVDNDSNDYTYIDNYGYNAANLFKSLISYFWIIKIYIFIDLLFP